MKNNFGSPKGNRATEEVEQFCDAHQEDLKEIANLITEDTIRKVAEKSNQMQREVMENKKPVFLGVNAECEFCKSSYCTCIQRQQDGSWKNITPKLDNLIKELHKQANAKYIRATVWGLNGNQIFLSNLLLETIQETIKITNSGRKMYEIGKTDGYNAGLISHDDAIAEGIRLGKEEANARILGELRKVVRGDDDASDTLEEIIEEALINLTNLK